MKRVAVILCAVFSVALAAEEVEIPKYMKICNRKSENVNDCLKTAIQDAIPKVSKGVPELNVPVLDPYYVALEEISYSNGMMQGKLLMKEVNAYGTSRAKILKVKSTFSEDRQRLEVDVLFPRIFIDGEYKAEGHLNDFKVGGKGFFNVSMEGVKTVWDITGRIENDRWVVEHFMVLPEVEKMKVYFDDLFNGDESLNNIARSFINEYWPLFYRELLPIASARWDKMMTDFANLVFSKLSYSKLFA
ncbi:protein takeout [Neodiprion pinetum]|uniref:Uncharacterized protein LOC107227098 n=1 Tax=Neodiprion lecontei TaxID=441921 RepID=A0A6J0CB44_NEOLC|nr:uncharacterized protein LOC107227098 [Neodiprion lecontei]XP_046477422.1 uncharacterized protein LOC124216664 [Neodiprion pinetum]